MLLDSRHLGWTGKALFVWLVCVVIFLLAPIIFLGVLSLDSSQWLTFPPPHLTLHWYHRFFTDQGWLNAIKTSLEVGSSVALFATLLGVPASFGLVRGKFPGKKALNAYFVLPMIIPVIVIAIALYSIFLKLGLTGTFIGFVLAHTVLALPFTIILTTTALRGFDEDIEKAAIICGASPFRSKTTITMRNILIGILSGALFAFLISWDEIVVALFMASPTLQTLPIKMWTTLRLELNPLVAVAGTLLALLSITIMSVIGLAQSWANGKGRKGNA